MPNAHDVVGFDRCANLDCRRRLTLDCVTVTTTRSVLRFCRVDCIGPGQAAWRRMVLTTGWI